MKNIQAFFTHPLFIVGGVFFVMTAVTTYPLIVEFTQTLPGIGDVYTYTWGLWWFMYSIIYLHQSPLETNFQFYPLHVNISQDISIFHGLLSLPITYTFGPIAAYNFILFFTFIVTGIGFYIFLKHVTHSALAAFFGAYIFTFSYGRLFRSLIGHLDVASTEWMGFILYYIYRLFIERNHTKGNIIWASIFLGLTAYTEYRNFFYIMIFVGVFWCSAIIFHFVFDRHEERTDNLVESLASIIKIVLLVYAFVFPIFVINLGKIGDIQYAPTHASFNADALAYILSPCHVFISRVFHTCYSAQDLEGGLVYLGIVPIVLALTYMGTKLNQNERRVFWIFFVSCAFFVVLSLGTATPLYTAMVDVIPMFKVMRVPARFGILVEVCVAVFASMGLAKVLKHGWHDVLRVALCIGIIVITVSETWLPNMTFINRRQIPERHLGFLKESKNYSMLEIPFGIRGNVYESFGSNETGLSFYFQMKHHIPLVGGYMSMLDWTSWNTFKTDSLISKILKCQDESICDPLLEEEVWRFNTVYKVKYITFLSTRHSQLEKYFVKYLGVDLVYRDETVAVFENGGVVK